MRKYRKIALDCYELARVVKDEDDRHSRSHHAKPACSFVSRRVLRFRIVAADV
jgi:hypothetical protein